MVWTLLPEHIYILWYMCCSRRQLLRLLSCRAWRHEVW